MKQRAGTDVGLMFIAYNLKSVVNIHGKQFLNLYFRGLLQGLLAKMDVHLKRKSFRVKFMAFYTILIEINEILINHTIFNRKMKMTGSF